MISKEAFLTQASKSYDQWISQNPSKKDAYNYEKDFEAWFLEFGRKILEGDRSTLSKSRNQKKKS